MKITYKELTVYEIENLYTQIKKELSKAKSSFTLNFANVEKIDLTAVQLLLSLKKECDNQKIKLKLTNLNARQIKQMLKIFNLNEELGISQ